MIITNLTHPGEPPIDGDLMRYQYDNGSVEEKTYYTPIPEPDPVRWLNANTFMSRFTDEELGLLQELADTNATIRGWVWWLNRQTAIDRDDPRVVSRLSQAVSAGKLTQERMDAILA